MTEKIRTRLCGSNTHSGGKCKKEAGWGTNHLGSGRCKYHGGVVGKNHGGQKGNTNALKHGIYSRILKDDDLDAAKQMQGSIDTELAIARLQLARVLEQMQEGDDPTLDQVEETTIAVDDPAKAAEKVRKSRAADAKRCGEYYDPDDDDDVPSGEESQPVARKRIFKRRDWTGEYTRLTALIARLESQRLGMQVKHLELERVKKAAQDGDDGTDNLTDQELDSLFLKLIEN